MGIPSLCLLVCLAGCHTYSTHVYGHITDEHKQPLSHIKLAVIRTHTSNSANVDSLAIAYTDEKGDYSTTFQTRRLYKKVQLISPHPLDTALANQHTGTTVFTGNRPSPGCCSIVVGKANKYSFVFQSKQ